MNRRLTALALALAVLAVLLSGCVTLPRYEWYVDPNQGPMDFYRWNVTDREMMPYVCGLAPSENGACAIRLNQGVILPTDKPLNGKPVIPGEGKLCVIQATMPEADAHKLPAQDWEMSLFDHELKHCHSILHNWIPGRIGSEPVNDAPKVKVEAK